MNDYLAAFPTKFLGGVPKSVKSVPLVLPNNYEWVNNKYQKKAGARGRTKTQPFFSSRSANATKRVFFFAFSECKGVARKTMRCVPSTLQWLRETVGSSLVKCFDTNKPPAQAKFSHEPENNRFRWSALRALRAKANRICFHARWAIRRHSNLVIQLVLQRRGAGFCLR